MKVEKGKKTKKERKSIPLSIKLDVIKRIDAGQRNINIMKAVQLPSSTIRTIYTQRHKILKFAETVGSYSNLSVVSKNRHPIMEKLEKHLMEWMDDSITRNISLNFLLIKDKAIETFNVLKAQAIKEGDHKAKDVDFKGSHGWFDRFRKRCCLYNKNKGINNSSTSEEIEDFSTKLSNIIQAGGYSKKQFFYMIETSLFWKRLMSLTCSSKANTQTIDASINEKLTLLLTSNLEGDAKVKPLLVHHFQNLKLEENINDLFPVICHSNTSAFISTQIFVDYIQNYFSTFVKRYCEKQGLPNKALLILGNVVNHPASVLEYSNNIQVLILPPNDARTLSLKPIITIFKANYTKIVMQYLVDKSRDNKNEVEQLWMDYDIKMGIKNIVNAWDKLSTGTMNLFWKEILPENAEDIEDNEMIKINICNEIVQLGFKIALQEVDFNAVQNILESDEYIIKKECQEKQTCAKNLQQQQQKKEIFVQQELLNNEFDPQKLESLFSIIEDACDIVDENDYNRKRARRTQNLLRSAINCYRQKSIGIQTDVSLIHPLAPTTELFQSEPSTSSASQF